MLDGEPQLPGAQGGASSPWGGREWGEMEENGAERNNDMEKGGQLMHGNYYIFSFPLNQWGIINDLVLAASARCAQVGWPKAVETAQQSTQLLLLFLCAQALLWGAHGAGHRAATHPMSKAGTAAGAWAAHRGC